jgi:ornithine carbamoyltransferase
MSSVKALRGEPEVMRHFLDLSDFDGATLRRLIDAARRRKKARAGFPRGAVDKDMPMQGRVLAMIFEKPSTRTRISFDVGMQELGGSTIMLTGAEMQLGRGETIADTARVLSRYVDVIMIRTLYHKTLLELAENAEVPVINGLTKASHPCQVMADVLTFEEKKGPIRGRTVAWVGDANNVLASWVHAASRFNFNLRIATPAELAPSLALRKWAKQAGANIAFMRDARQAVAGVDCVVTDTWVSMGDKEGSRRHNLLKPYRVDAKLMARADQGAVFMHCLPAHREDEVTDEVIDGPQSVVFDEAENRLHAQKAILNWCLG